MARVRLETLKGGEHARPAEAHMRPLLLLFVAHMPPLLFDFAVTVGIWMGRTGYKYADTHDMI